MKYAFELFSGIPCEVVPTIELSRFYKPDFIGNIPNNPLVICVSNSGTVARVGEAVQKTNHFGALTLGITGNINSILGQNAKKILKLEIPFFESAPGVRSYLVSLLSLLLLAIRFGEVKCRFSMDKANLYRCEIKDQSEKLRKMLPEIDLISYQIANNWMAFEAFDFVGAGFDYATAWYGHAKVFEATGDYAMHINSEEWFHLNCFIRNIRGTGTIIISNSTNPAKSRTDEMINYVVKMERPAVLITDSLDYEEKDSLKIIRVPMSQFPMMLPLTQFVPISLIFGYIAAMKNEEPGRGCKNEWQFCKDGAAIRNSQIEF